MRTSLRTQLVFVGCVLAFAAWASDVTGLQGTYKHAPDQSNDVSQAIDKAVEKMNFIKRPIARSRLAKTNTPYQRIHIELGVDEAAVTFDTRQPIRTPLDGRPIKWTRDDGEVFEISATLADGKLLQTFKAADGTRVNSFHKDASGALHLDVEVSSSQLPQPVKYELVYRPVS